MKKTHAIGREPGKATARTRGLSIQVAADVAPRYHKTRFSEGILKLTQPQLLQS